MNQLTNAQIIVVLLFLIILFTAVVIKATENYVYILIGAFIYMAANALVNYLLFRVFEKYQAEKILKPLGL